jgi:predicted metal-dependent hydrolase
MQDEDWPSCRLYLYGFDLFNRGFFWEAHEAWESLWHANGRKGPVADFLKALIKLAAAGVKHLERVPRGTATHALRAAQVWQTLADDRVGNDQVFLGLSLRALIDLGVRVAARGWPDSGVVLVPRTPGG